LERSKQDFRWAAISFGVTLADHKARDQRRPYQNPKLSRTMTLSLQQ
jgi:hypothetical protein